MKKKFWLGASMAPVMVVPLVAVSCLNSKQRQAKKKYDSFMNKAAPEAKKEFEKSFKSIEWEKMTDEECDALIKAIEVIEKLYNAFNTK